MVIFQYSLPYNIIWKFGFKHNELIIYCFFNVFYTCK